MELARIEGISAALELVMKARWNTSGEHESTRAVAELRA